VSRKLTIVLLSVISDILLTHSGLAQTSCQQQYNTCSANVTSGFNGCEASARTAPAQYQQQLLAQCQSSYNSGLSGCEQVYTSCLNAPVAGYINPKYLVVGVVYAPPGVQSTVAYTQSNTVSLTSNVSSIFGSGTQVSVKITGSTGLPGFFQTTETGSTTTSANESSMSSDTTTVSFGQSVQNTYAGTPVFNMPINHNYDQILVWLNPITLISVLPNQHGQIQFNGYAYDEADSNVIGLDIVPIPLGCLNGGFPATNCQQYSGELNRSWANGQQVFAQGQGPALTQADLNNIASVDPLSNANYVFTPTSSYPNTTKDGRFTLSGGVNGVYDYFSYTQANPGQSPGRTVLTNTYTNMDASGQSSTSSYQEAFGVDTKFSGGTFFGDLTIDIGTTQTFTWTNTAGTSVNNTNTQTDTATIVDPACTGTTVCVPQSTAPIQWNVFQDNIYGTFEFQP
jgi:hypothetical protein